MDKARDLIERLMLQPHPEGGWYRETWRGPARGDGRAVGTAIHFLLEAGQSSHWHTVDASEIWLWHSGDQVHLRLAATDAGPVETVVLGDAIADGDCVQHVVPEGHWQAAAPVPDGAHGYALVSCVVTPGFDFAGFRLAAPGWAPGA